jgi:hypothetical protein
MRSTLITVAAAAGVLAAAFAAPALPALSSAGGPPRATTAFTVFAADSQGFSRHVDLDGSGLGPGDLILQKTPLLDTASGDRVGTLVARTQVVKTELEGDDALAILDATALLSSGRVVFSGSFRTGLNFVHTVDVPFAVLGGTGSYDGARGTAFTRNGTFQGLDGTFLRIELISG